MKKSIDLVLTAKDLEKKTTLINSTVVIYDVLRASSTIITALAHGARSVIPVLTPAEALEAYQNLKDLGIPALLGGERKGERIKGFHLGNSPLEYMGNKIFDHIIVFTTTNGTKAIVNSQKLGAKEILIGSILNQNTISNYLKNKNSFTIVCAGVKDEFAFEDFYAAGLMLNEILKSTESNFWELSDSALAALRLAQQFPTETNIIGQGANAKRLNQKNRGEDIQFCASVNNYLVLPIYSQDKISLNSAHQSASN